MLKNLLNTLLHKQRKLFATGMTSLAITAGFVFGVLRGGGVEALYNTFTDALALVLGVFVAGNAGVHLWQSKWGSAKLPESGALPLTGEPAKVDFDDGHGKPQP